jgi:hypothetical protein
MKLNTPSQRLDFARMGLWAPEALRSRSAVRGCHSNQAVIPGITAGPPYDAIISQLRVLIPEVKMFVLNDMRKPTNFGKTAESNSVPHEVRLACKRSNTSLRLSVSTLVDRFYEPLSMSS